MNPNNWLTVWCFLAIATSLSVSYGWLVKKEKLPFNSVIAFNDAQWQFLKIWVNIAGVLGVLIPVILLIVLRNSPEIREFLNFYLLVVVIQLISESVFSRILCKSVVVIVGTLYTGFRIWQLQSALPLFSYFQPWLSLLWLVLIFWIANMIMLTTMAIPCILPPLNNYNSSNND
jgi:hypothetical protein